MLVQCTDLFTILNLVVNCPFSMFCASRYFQAGGNPEHVIQLLSENYTAVAQTVNLLAEWLIQSGLLMQNVACDIRNHTAYNGADFVIWSYNEALYTGVKAADDLQSLECWYM